MDAGKRAARRLGELVMVVTHMDWEWGPGNGPLECGSSPGIVPSLMDYRYSTVLPWGSGTWTGTRLRDIIVVYKISMVTSCMSA